MVAICQECKGQNPHGQICPPCHGTGYVYVPKLKSGSSVTWTMKTTKP